MGEIKGLATGIGSLPHTDINQALGLIFKHIRDIPFWPQLPKLNPLERMVAQFGEGFPCLELTDDGLLYNPKDRDRELELFYAKIIGEDLDYFKITQRCAHGLYGFRDYLRDSGSAKAVFIKCQITGPFTFAASLKDEEGTLLLHDAIFLQVIIKALAMKALWQIKFFKEFGKDIILFIDEPYLGCFGSAYTPISREQVLKGLGELTGAIKSDGILVGVHCCGNTDWSIFTDIDGIDIISLDAFSFLDKFVLYADNIKSFLQRGGVICWGIVPTQEFTGRETAKMLSDRLRRGIDILRDKKVNNKLLYENLLISPACGLGTLSSDKAQHILELTREVSDLIRA